LSLKRMSHSPFLIYLTPETRNLDPGTLAMP
jgi:hypothetical protein